MLKKIASWFDFRKTVIIIGGNSELGTALTKKFGRTWIKRWNVFNIDAQLNANANYNFFLDLSKPITNEDVTRLHTELKKNFKEIDAMINLAEPPARQPLSIADANIFETYNQERMMAIQSSILLTHLSSNFLSANGYVAFNGGNPSLFQGGEMGIEIDSITRIAKGVATKQGLDLS